MKNISVVITNSHSVPDMQLEDWYYEVLNTPHYGYGESVIYLSTGVMLDRLRLGVVRGDLNQFKIQCEVTGWSAKVINEFGNLDNWQNYPLDVGLRNTTSILTEGIKIRKQRREDKV